MEDSKVAVVTGAASGIGRAIALRLAADGNRVVGIDLNEDGLNEVADEVRGSGGQFLPEVFDLFEVERIPTLIDGVIQRLGRTDILVHSAYCLAPERFFDISFGDKWDRQIRVNLSALIALSQCCARDMATRNWGRIINISSVAADRGVGGPHVYSMVKGAINSLTRHMALELAPLGVRVNAISPAWIKNAALDGMPEERREAIRRRTPLQRLGRPQDIAAFAAFLASDEADYCVGSIFVVDGGYCLVSPSKMKRREA